jgi:hypothetical protein
VTPMSAAAPGCGSKGVGGGGSGTIGFSGGCGSGLDGSGPDGPGLVGSGGSGDGGGAGTVMPGCYPHRPAGNPDRSHPPEFPENDKSDPGSSVDQLLMSAHRQPGASRWADTVHHVGISGGNVMQPVVVVFVVWFAIVIVGGLIAIALAPRLHSPNWWLRLRARYYGAVEGVTPQFGRLGTALTVWLALWSVLNIVTMLLGELAHRLQPSIDEPAFRWWNNHHLIQDEWYRVWWKLTNIGSPTLTQELTIAGAVLLGIIWFRKPMWWAPSLTLLLAYPAEKYSQMIAKAVVHRGNPTTTLGTWPSGGMGRLIDIYGLIIFFVILRFWPHNKRVWAAGWSLLAILTSIQAYARLNNLEHWTTDVVGGLFYGLMLLAMMIIGYYGLTWSVRRSDPEPSASGGSHRPAKEADSDLVPAG